MDTWGGSWGGSWALSWGQGVIPPIPEILSRGDGVPYKRKKRKREDTEYVPPEFDVSEAVDKIFNRLTKPANDTVEEVKTAPKREYKLQKELVQALKGEPLKFKVPNIQELRERDDEEAIMLLLQ